MSRASNPPVRRAHRPGPNEPCSCGSGKSTRGAVGRKDNPSPGGDDPDVVCPELLRELHRTMAKAIFTACSLAHLRSACRVPTSCPSDQPCLVAQISLAPRRTRPAHADACPIFLAASGGECKPPRSYGNYGNVLRDASKARRLTMVRGCLGDTAKASHENCHHRYSYHPSGGHDGPLVVLAEATKTV